MCFFFFLKFVLLPSLLPGECSVIGLAPRVLGWHHGSATCAARVTWPDAQQGPELVSKFCVAILKSLMCFLEVQLITSLQTARKEPQYSPFSSLALFLLLLGPLRMGGPESTLRSVIKVPETESFRANGSVPLPPSLLLARGLAGRG